MATQPSFSRVTNLGRINADLVRSQTQGDHSMLVNWEKSYLCPCRNPQTDQPDPNCKICYGTGIAYLTPVQVHMIITSQSKGVRLNAMGQTDSGIAYGTVDTKEQDINGGISFRDRVTLPNVKLSQSMIFNVTQDRVDNGFFLHYDINTLDLAVSSNYGNLVEGTHYTIDYEKNRFHPKPILLGDNISLNIRVTLRYIVVDLLKENRYEFKPMTIKKVKYNQYIPLPKKLLLRREDAFIRSESFDVGKGDSTNMVDPKVIEETSGFSQYFKSFYGNSSQKK